MTTPPPHRNREDDLRKFRKIPPPNPPRLPVKCKSTGTTSLISYQRSRSNIHRNGAKSHSGAMFTIGASIHRKTSYRLTGGLKFYGRITGRDREAYENFVTPYTKSAGYYPKSVVPLLGAKKNRSVITLRHATKET